MSIDRFPDYYIISAHYTRIFLDVKAGRCEEAVSKTVVSGQEKQVVSGQERRSQEETEN
ncbi:MAG: hypothetical protein AB1611_20320 [bacterium]